MRLKLFRELYGVLIASMRLHNLVLLQVMSTLATSLWRWGMVYHLRVAYSMNYGRGLLAQFCALTIADAR